MTVRIGHASIDENSKAHGGTAGDQSGKEVKISNYYLHSKGWVVLRCKDADKRERIAEAMEKACNNAQIGYDQYQRNTLFDNVKGSGFDPSQTTKAVETDCSALVRVCIAYAYGEDKAGNIRTVSEPAALVKTGLFEKLTEDKYCKSSDYLLRGDILCTPVSGHTVVFLDNGSKITSNTTKGDYTMEMRYLKKGCEGEDVRALQILLIGRGYSCGKYGADGDFGSDTKSAVKRFQKAKALAVDGIVGPDTMSALMGL